MKQGDIPSVLLILSLGESMRMLVNVTSELLSGQDYQVTFQADYTLLYFNQALVFVPINTRGLDFSLLVSVKQGDIPSVLLILSLGESMPMLVM